VEGISPKEQAHQRGKRTTVLRGFKRGGEGGEKQGENRKTLLKLQKEEGEVWLCENKEEDEALRVKKRDGPVH